MSASFLSLSPLSLTRYASVGRGASLSGERPAWVARYTTPPYGTRKDGTSNPIAFKTLAETIAWTRGESKYEV